MCGNYVVVTGGRHLEERECPRDKLMRSRVRCDCELFLHVPDVSTDRIGVEVDSEMEKIVVKYAGHRQTLARPKIFFGGDNGVCWTIESKNKSVVEMMSAIAGCLEDWVWSKKCMYTVNAAHLGPCMCTPMRSHPRFVHRSCFYTNTVRRNQD